MSKKDNKLESNGESLNLQRLSKTFSKPPDLLLTGSKNNQRSQNSKKNNYAPNLNVIRNKNLDVKTNEKDSKRDQSSRGRGRGKDARPNNKRVNPNLVQTMGFLSEGIGDVAHQKKEYSGGFSRDTGNEVIQKPRLNKREVKHNKEDLEKEQKILSNLLEEDGMDDEIKTPSDEIVPIKINHVSSNNIKLEDVKIKLEAVEVKNECIDEANGIPSVKVEPGLELKSEFYHRMDRLFRPESNEVVLFQLPDTLPQKLPDEEEGVSQSTEDEASIAKPVQKLSSLEHFSEGLIGKLVRYRSGKTKLMIGDYMYDVETAISTGFQQNVVSISSNPQERSANMYSIGEIHAKYNVIPDWNWLFDKLATS
ncbi:DNA-directed RNA polymerase III subunit RPC4 [Chironomus tepperi]|uniref:DNA-directed RNA polymerase III subunit RPC4 n=1 Tax=Chironomus tepperi TaxID=113505 RepID=UPI00391F1D8E